MNKKFWLLLVLLSLCLPIPLQAASDIGDGDLTYGTQRNFFKDQYDQYWAFFSDGSDFVHYVSADGSCGRRARIADTAPITQTAAKEMKARL